MLIEEKTKLIFEKKWRTQILFQEGSVERKEKRMAALRVKDLVYSIKENMAFCA